MNARSLILWILVTCLVPPACDRMSPTIVITAEEFRFSPAHVEASNESTLHVLIRNQGRERHVFHSPALFSPDAGIKWHQPMDTFEEPDTLVLEPGQSIEFHVTLPPGLYPYRCWIKGHTGMEGSLLVHGPSSSSSL